MVAVVVLGTLSGLALRLWMVFHGTSNSDNDVVGLIAHAGLHGHFQVFYGGQNYGGTAEPYLIAVAFAVFGQSIIVAELVLLVLAAVSSLLVWRIVLRVIGDGRMAALAGVLSWCAPAASFRVSTYLYGFRGVTLVCGLALILFALRCHKGPRPVDAGLVGLFAGIGWWSSPEIAYFAVPALVLLVVAVATTGAPRFRTWVTPALVALGAFAVGALPWIWANVRSGFASLDQAPYEKLTHLGYGGRLRVAVEYLLPLELGLRRGGDGHELLGGAYPVVLVIFLAFLVAALVLCLARGGAAMALAIGVLAFPLVYAVAPLTWFWQDGRYGIYLPPLLAIVLSVGIFEGCRRLGLSSSTGTLTLAVAVLLAGALAVYGADRVGVPLAPSAFAAGWGNPDDPTVQLAHQLEADGIRVGYANYWVAYKLDFDSQERLQIATAGADVDRSPAIDAAVRRGARPAYLFVPAADAVLGDYEFSAPKLIVGPDSATESFFRARLEVLGVPYRVIDTGALTAIVPERTVTPAEAGLPGGSNTPSGATSSGS